MSIKGAPLQEAEVQKIIKLLTSSVNTLYQKQIIHRDININNVILHFPDIEPTSTELQNPRLLEVMEKKKEQMI